MALHITKGNIIQIQKERYQILQVLEEIDKFDTENDKLVGKHTEYSLHKNGNKSLHPTHILKVYYDSQEKGVLLEISYSKSYEELPGLKQKYRVTNYTNKRIISTKDIQVIS